MAKVNSKLNAPVMQTALRFILTLFFKITSFKLLCFCISPFKIKISIHRDKISLTPLSYSVNIWSFYRRLS